MEIERAFNQNYQILNLTEKKVLSQILAQKSTFTNLTLADLAHQTSVSQSFLIRLCKKIGFSGYSEFKYQLKLESKHATNTLSSQDLLQANQASLQETLALLKIEQLDDLCQQMQQAAHIYTYATGYGAKNILEDFKRGMISAKKAIISFPTSIELKLNSSVMQKDDILFVVSMSGQAHTVLSTLPILKAKGIIIVSITRFIVNPLASLAAINLYLETTKTDEVYTSYVPLCLILDLIVKRFLNLNP
ncbi:MurR/RpiR family transcriptional regulator [Lactobacillus sp. DCY120]|uniref:MurR/RpiR family transcriptional regulator n=1 Tax=Bombilactobacillus apium TaxID=2675299 RepID=A0A850RBS8_9LACO|nr:MurR/RpiR family transcriptional regulator [Bombilactobacillus apium]NVY96248.1 MurR/RpiR family transcriptional regulator [Bombilactobacillus apium]